MKVLRKNDSDEFFRGGLAAICSPIVTARHL
jgi:hypothetical protein